MRCAEMATIRAIMARRQSWTLAFASEVTKQLQAIDAKDHALIREQVGEQLRCEPAAESVSAKERNKERLWIGGKEVRL